MKHQKGTFFSIVFLLLISIDLHAQELIPLEVNNYWKYQTKIIQNKEVTQADTIVSRVGKTLTYNKKTWYFLNEFGHEYVVRNSEAGQYEIDSLSIEPNGNFKEVLMFKRPKKSKSSFYTAYDNINITIGKNRKIIKTSLGKFKCYKYTLTGENSDVDEKITIYIKPGIGIIYHSTENPYETTIYELIDYKLE